MTTKLVCYLYISFIDTNKDLVLSLLSVSSKALTADMLHNIYLAVVFVIRIAIVTVLVLAYGERYQWLNKVSILLILQNPASRLCEYE